jgi:hypothetical protein
MALSANTILEVRAAGSDTNGGGFVNGAAGTDYSQQNAANSGSTDKSTTDAVANGTTTLTSAAANFGTSIVGNIIYLAGGTGSLAAGWYQVTARASATSITLDRTVATGTGITMNIGGALATPGQASAIAVVGNVVYLFNAGSTVYSITSATTNVANGCVNSSGGTVIFVGYSVTRSLITTDTGPTIQLNVSTATILQGFAAAWNLILDGNSQTASKATAANTLIYRSAIKNMTGAGSVAGTAFFCSATACTGTVFTNSCYYCEGYVNSACPFVPAGSQNVLIGNVSRDNTGATTDGFNLGIGGRGGIASHNTSVRNARDGFRVAFFTVLSNNIAESNTGAPFNFTGANIGFAQNNAYYGNGSGITYTGQTAMNFDSGNIAVTAGSVFTNAAGNDYSLNNTASQGALLRAAGFPATLPLGTTANYRDIGAAQHQAAGGGVIVIDDD